MKYGGTMVHYTDKKIEAVSKGCSMEKREGGWVEGGKEGGRGNICKCHQQQQQTFSSSPQKYHLSH